VEDSGEGRPLENLEGSNPAEDAAAAAPAATQSRFLFVPDHSATEEGEEELDGIGEGCRLALREAEAKCGVG